MLFAALLALGSITGACGDDDDGSRDDTPTAAGPNESPTSATSPDENDTATPEPTVQQPEDFAVVDVSFTVGSWTDGIGAECPLVEATITTNAPGTVRYLWTRSDGAAGAAEELVFPVPGSQTVDQQWGLGGDAPEGSYWIGLTTAEPTDRDWGHADVTRCQGGTPTPAPSPTPTVAASSGMQVVNVVLTADTWSDDFYKNCPVVRVEIETDGAGTVTYRWTRSDSSQAQRQVLEFTEAGKQTIEETWTLGSGAPDDTYWIGIFIEGPNEQDWGHAEIERCESP